MQKLLAILELAFVACRATTPSPACESYGAYPSVAYKCEQCVAHNGSMCAYGLMKYPFADFECYNSTTHSCAAGTWSGVVCDRSKSQPCGSGDTAPWPFWSSVTRASCIPKNWACCGNTHSNKYTYGCKKGSTCCGSERQPGLCCDDATQVCKVVRIEDGAQCVNKSVLV